MAAERKRAPHRPWIIDLWVKDAVVTLDDGSTMRVSPTGDQLKNIRALPEQFRSAKYGQGSRWLVRWIDPHTGKTKQRAFEKRGEAEAAKSDVLNEVARTSRIDTRFKAVAKEWLASKHHVKGSTIRRYQRELNTYVLPRWGDMQVGEITRQQVDKWVQELNAGTAPRAVSRSKHVSKEKAAEEVYPLQPSYVRHIVKSTFGGALGYAVEERLIAENPVSRVSLSRKTPPGGIIDFPDVSHQEIELLASEAAAVSGRSDDRVLVLTLAYLGLRIGEATALRVEDLDPDERSITVARTWTVDRHGRRDLGTPKAGESRKVPVPTFLLKEIQALTSDRGPNDFIFRTVRGHAIDDANFRARVWKAAQVNVGFAHHLRIHDLRHVAASFAIAAGADVKLVQRMLGHKDATITLNTYAHLFERHTTEVVDLMEEARRRALES